MTPDEVPDWIAELDQISKGMSDFAKILRSYHVELIDAGFEPSEALTLTIEWQKAMLNQRSEDS